jgi:hypothetical protein
MPTPSATSRPSSTATPLLTPIPSPNAWQQLDSGSAIWAPDSLHFASRSGAVRIYDAAGDVLATQSLRWASWLDNANLVGIDPNATFHAQVVDITTGTSSTLVLPHDATSAIANGHGAAAFSWPRDHDWPDTHYNYVVWNGQSFSEPKDGFAQTWSADGSELAVFHQFDHVRSPSGWVSVVSWPELQTTFADAPPYAAGAVDFDPTSQYLAYATDTGEPPATDTFLIRIVELATGTVADIPRDDYGVFYWTSSGQLVSVGQDGVTRTYEPSGVRTATSQESFGAATASEDGSTAVLWNIESDGTMQVIRFGSGSTITAPAGIGRVSVSPDGSALVIDTDANESYIRHL